VISSVDLCGLRDKGDQRICLAFLWSVNCEGIRIPDVEDIPIDATRGCRRPAVSPRTRGNLNEFITKYW
jgi:hypothetical protein